MTTVRAALAFLAALALATAFFLLFPGIDLWVSGLFYRAGDGFFLAHAWPMRAVYSAVFVITDAVVVVVPLLFIAGLLRGRPLWGVDRKVALFLLLSLALGPGILVNTVLKDHWGRARPSQISEFGGTQRFTPAPMPADQCARNCSFPAGHPAMGFYLVSFALMVADERRRRIATGAAIAAGAAVGAVRLAQGGHFLSDVVFSGILVTATSWFLHRAIVVQDRLGALFRDARPPRWLLYLALATMVSTLLSIAFIDRPVARFFHDSNPALHDVFQFITQFGLAKGYLIISGVLFIGLRGGAYVASDAALGRRLLLNAHRALFIFLVAAIPGLVADLLKLVFGRARPKLLFNDNVYDFFWGASRSDHWSMPSGHATTIVGLALAFWLLWPRARPAYALIAALVAASRFIIGAHFVSDVLCGAVLGGVITWAIWTKFSEAGIALAGDAPAPRATEGASEVSDSP